MMKIAKYKNDNLLLEKIKLWQNDSLAIAIGLIILRSIDEAVSKPIDQFFITLIIVFVSLIIFTLIITLALMSFFWVADKATGCFSKNGHNFSWQEKFIMSIFPALIGSILDSMGAKIGYFLGAGIGILTVFYVQELKRNFNKS